MILKTDRPPIAARTAALIAVVSLSGVYAPARAVDPKVSTPPQNLVPFELSRDSVLRGVPLKIGDLSLVSEPEAGTLARSAAADPTVWERCLQAGPDWLRWSDDGKSLDLKSPWGSPSRDQVLTAYCNDGIILIGGYQRRAADDDSHRWTWIFTKIESWSSPAKVSFLDRPFAVGSWPRQTRYALNEVRAIDPVSRRILFAGTSEDGKEALLAAPFAIVSVGSARR